MAAATLSGLGSSGRCVRSCPFLRAPEGQALLKVDDAADDDFAAAAAVQRIRANLISFSEPTLDWNSNVPCATCTALAVAAVEQ